MGERIKFSYEPSERKRFEIASDEYSRERLAIVKSFYEAMHRSFDVPMGLALFGSLSKGKELDIEKIDASDIDFTLYIDLDAYKRKYIENLKNNKDFSEFEVRRLGEFFRDSSARKLLDNGIRKIREGEEITPEEKDFFEKRLQVFNFDQFIFFLAVWHGYTILSDSGGAPQKFSFRGKPQYPIERINHLLRIKDVQVWPIQFEGEFSIKNQVQRVRNLCESVSKEKGTQHEYVLDQERCGIARIFGLDIGGGMKPYRQSFVRELLLLPQEEGGSFGVS